MNLDALYSELTLKLKTKIVLVVLDGLGDIATREQNFLTPLEAATTPNLDVLAKGLKGMVSTAISLCMDNQLPIVGFNLHEKGALTRVVNGEAVGTLVHN